LAPVAPVAPYGYEDDWELEPVIAPIEPFEPFEPLEPMEPMEPLEPVDMADVLQEALANDTFRLKDYKGNFTIVHQGKDKKEYTFRMENGVLVALEVDNKPVPKTEYKNYSFIVDEIRQDSEIRQAEAMSRQDQAIVRQMDARRRMEIDRERISQQRRALQERISYDRERAIRENGELRRQQRHEMQMALKDQERALREHERAMQNHERAMRDHEVSMRKHEMALKIREELIKDKLLKNENNYKLKLDKQSLYIDGQKQPEAVFEKYKKMVEKEHGPLTDDFIMDFQHKKDDK
jgi:hypothetical protein